MKKVIALISAFIVTILIAASPVLAQTVNSGDNQVLERNQTINGDYFSAGEKVTLSGTVNGDAYVAGGNVLVDGTINGDLIAAGGNVIIRGTVMDDIRVAGGNVTVSSQVGKNLTVLGGSVTISENSEIAGSLVAGVGNLQILAPITRGMTIGAGTVLIGNSVGGDITAGVGEMSFSQDASVAGNLEYWSEFDAEIPQGASISGSITKHAPPQGTTKAAESAVKGVFEAISIGVTLASFLSALVLGLLLIKFAPRYIENVSDNVLNAPARSLLYGLIFLVVVPVLAFFLFITLLFIPLSIVIMILYFLAMYVSKIFVAYALGRKVAEALNVKWAKGLVYLAGLVIFYLVTAIPVIGWIISLAALLLGLGALIISKNHYYNTLTSKKII